jgi:hypothetical protein
MKSIILIIFLLFLFLFGIICLLYPDKIQSIAVKAVRQGNLMQNGLLEIYVKSKSYLFVVRSVGFCAICMSVFLVLAVIFSKT